MFLNQPHSTHRYYGELLKSYGNRLFLESHFQIPYYTSALALASLEEQFQKERLPRDLKKFKYQLIMMFRVKVCEQEMPYLNSRRIEPYCEQMIEILENGSRATAVYRELARLLEEAEERQGGTLEPLQRTRAFSESLQSAVSEVPLSLAAGLEERVQGVVKWFSEIRGYGFVTTEDNREVFVHFTDIDEEGYYFPRSSELVELTVVDTPKGLKGENVRVVEQ